MDFNVETFVFPSAVHRGIYSMGRGLVPLDRSLSGAGDAALRSSCTALHAFVTDMLSDMYECPESYGLPVGALEAFCGGRKVNGVKQKHPSKMKNLLAQTRNAAPGYLVLLYHLGREGRVEGDRLAVPAGKLEAIYKNAGTSASPIPLDARLAALERVGLVREGDGLASGNHPDMFPALCALAAKAGKQSGFDYFAFQTLDFRNLAGRHKPNHEDYFRPLAAAQREQAYALHDFAVDNGLKPLIQTFWKTDYKYKDVQVLCIGTEGDRERLLDIRIVGAYHWDDPAPLDSRLRKQPPAFQRDVLRHIWRCDACATTHLGMFITVLGKKQRVCGGGLTGFRWRNPGEADMKTIKTLIRMRCAVIDDLKAAESARVAASAG